jgi:hypothetical protein
MKNLAQKLDENLMVLSNIIQLDSYRDITAANERKYPIVIRSSYHSKENYSYVFPTGFKIRKMPPAFSLKEPFIQRSEKYSFQGSSLEVSIEKKSFDHTIKLTDLNDFKKYALEVQKHESLLKNIILGKK